jgi:hypothetical protein
MVGCVNGAVGLGTDPAPEGGAKFRAGPLVEASGTEAGGTGGGRSLKSWAQPEVGIREISAIASAHAWSARLSHPHLPMLLPQEAMAMLFTENTANSSLRHARRNLMEP